MSKAVLVDLTKCIGCRSCQVACKQWNDLPADTEKFSNTWDTPIDTTDNTWTRVKYYFLQEGKEVKWRFVKRQCMHCQRPACVAVCTSGALTKTPDGPVIFNAQKCTGCAYCFSACPFGMPRYTSGNWGGVVLQKCRFCFDLQGTYDRVGRGQAPACVRACPAGALMFGERDLLLKEARARIAAAPGRYVNHIYGERELGGTSWLYLADVSFHDLGFPFVSFLSAAATTATKWTPVAVGMWFASKYQSETGGDVTGAGGGE